MPKYYLWLELFYNANDNEGTEAIHIHAKRAK